MKNYFALWHSISNICSTKVFYKGSNALHLLGLFLCPAHNKKVVQHPHCIVVMAIQALVKDFSSGKGCTTFFIVTKY